MTLKYKLIKLGETPLTKDEYTGHLLVYTVPEATVSKIIAFSNAGGSLYWNGRDITHPNRRLLLTELSEFKGHNIERDTSIENNIGPWQNIITPTATMISGVRTIPQYLAPGDKIYWGGFHEEEDIMTTYKDVSHGDLYRKHLDSQGNDQYSLDEGKKIHKREGQEEERSKNGVLYLFIDEMTSDSTTG